MKRGFCAVLAVVVLSAISIADQSGQKKAWIDLQGCDMCKHMGDNMEMMQHVTWENHKIANGMLSASVVPKKYREQMNAVHEKMKAVGEKAAKGGKLTTCGHCESFGKLVMAGAKTEEIKTDFGYISLVTSSDPEVVKKIHEHTDTTVKEFAAYLAKHKR